MFKPFILLFTLLVTTSVAAEPLYWKASKGDLEYLLFGTVHVGQDAMYPLPEPVTEYLALSDGLVVEADLNEVSQVKYPMATMSSHSVLTPQQQAELKGISALLNLNPDILLQSPPWATALSIQLSQFAYLGYSAELGVDTALTIQALQKRVPLYTLETMQFQVDLLTSLNNEGEELLISAIEDFDKAEPLTHCLIDSWKKGDKGKLETFGQLTALSPQFETTFITNRNHDWAKKLTTGSVFPESKGKYLVAVGALHLVGKQNLPSLLKSQGFDVKQVSVSDKSECHFEY